MKNFKLTGFLIVLILLGPLCAAGLAQQQSVFDWQPGNNEAVRLDPANYHSGKNYGPSPDGGKIHVDIKSQLPVTVFLTDAAEWSEALQHPENISNLQQICPQQHVVELSYACALPPVPTTLVIRDERVSPDAAVFAGLGAVMQVVDPDSRVENAVETTVATVATIFTGHGSPTTRKFVAPNDVQIQYYQWVCMANCIQPEFQWVSQIKEKYPLTSFLKVYGGFAPDHDQTNVDIKINSPTPMIVAMLPSQVADHLYSKPDGLEPALENNACQQRGVQKLEFQCTFNMADGPQSLIVVPEPGSKVSHKKAEVEMQAVKCAANCQLIQPSGQPDATRAQQENQ